MKHINIVKLAAVACAFLVLYGCAGNPTRSVSTVSEQDTVVALEVRKEAAENAVAEFKQIAAEEREAINEGVGVYWVQPENITEECKIWSSGWHEDATIFWDGGCKDGYAYGLGREFLTLMTKDGIVDREDIAYYAGGKYRPQYLSTFDRVNRRLLIYPYDSELAGLGFESVVTTELITDDNGSELITTAVSFEKVIQSGYAYALRTRSSDNDYRELMQISPGTADNGDIIFKYWGELYNHDTVFMAQDAAYAFGKLANGRVRHLNLKTKEDIQLPESYIKQILEIEKLAKTEIAELLSMTKKSQDMINYYLGRVCQDSKTISFMNNERYKEICGENSYFTQYMPAVLKTQQDALASRKSSYEQWVAQQDRNRQIALQQQMAAAAQRQADAAEQANFQNNMNAIINNGNSMMNSFKNSAPVQLYQPPRATAPTYYNRVGDSIVGGGTTCTGIGNSIICR